VQALPACAPSLPAFRSLADPAAGLFVAIPAVIFLQSVLQKYPILAQRLDTFSLEVAAQN